MENKDKLFSHPKTIGSTAWISYYNLSRKITSEAHRIFVSNLKKAINTSVSENSGAEIINLLDDRVLEIVSPYVFFSSNTIYTDNTESEIAPQCSSIEEYFTKVLLNTKHKVSIGVTNLCLNSFLLSIASFIHVLKPTMSQFAELKSQLKSFLLAFTDTVNPVDVVINPNKVTIRIIGNLLRNSINNNGLQVSNRDYEYAVKLLLDAYCSILTDYVGFKVVLPQLEVLYGISTYYKEELYKKLSILYNISIKDVESVLSKVSVFSSTNSEVTVALNCLKRLSHTKGVTVEEGMQIIEEVSLRKTLVHKEDTELEEWLNPSLCSNPKLNIKRSYVNTESYYNMLSASYAQVAINLSSSMKKKEVLDLIEVACKVCSLRSYNPSKGKHIPTYLAHGYPFRIILNNTPFINSEFSVLLEEKKRDLEDKYQRNILIEINYNEDEVKESATMPLISENIVILSDIHYDINRKKGYDFSCIPSDAFAIVCGDISSSSCLSKEWLDTYIKQGVFVHGNHLGYNTGNLKGEIKTLEKEYTTDKPVSFLNNSYKIYNGVLFIGCCLYTDFTLFGADKAYKTKALSQLMVNDFKNVNYNKRRCLSPEDYVGFFNKSRNYILEKTLEFNNYPAVIVTHFAPFPKSIDSKYKGHYLNPYFCNDMTDVVLKRPNIVMWCHGHVHQPLRYEHHGVKVIARPFGYFNENKYRLKVGKGKQLTADAYASITFTELKNTPRWLEYKKKPVGEQNNKPKPLKEAIMKAVYYDKAMSIKKVKVNKNLIKKARDKKRGT